MQVGFDPYVAIEEQSLVGLRENIFERLRTSEYFIFVDFKREQLAGTGAVVNRGSLFSHQELAIASFLEMDVIALQERGVKTDDGIIRFLQTNPIPFTDRDTLPHVIADIVHQRDWNSSWRNELVLERRRDQAIAAKRLDGTIATFFHIDVRNHHQQKLATNCYVYLEKAVRVTPTAETIPLKTVEFKWAGTTIPGVGIAPRSVREFDAFQVAHNTPTVLDFAAFCDSTEYIPRFSGAGQYELSYVVRAGNFPPARGSFKLNLDPVLARTTFV